MVPKEQSLVLETTEYLQPGQNFFDQPPFEQILSETSDQLDLPRLQMNYVVHRLSGLFKDVDISVDISEHPIYLGLMDPTKLNKFCLAMRAYFFRKNISIPEKRSIRKSLITLVGGMNSYPQWIEYINTQKDVRFYSPDGECTIDKMLFTTNDKVPSYLHWISQYKDAHTPLRWGMSEVFPQNNSSIIFVSKPRVTPRWFAR